MSDQSPRLNWVTVGALAVFHIGAVAALFLFAWQALWVALALLWVSGGWGIGMGYHRLLTHRGYQTPRWLECLLTICGTLALQGGPLFWVATHRLHHQNADKNGDPHSPRDGWWWSHAGWLVRGDPMRDAALAAYVPDLRRDPFHCWMEKWHVVPMLVLSVVLAVWGAVREGAFLAASLVSWGICLRTTVELHGTWLVNSAAHTWGRRRFQTRDDSTNNWWVALLTFGEGWHTTTTPIQGASATASPGMSSISTGSASERSTISGLRGSSASERRSAALACKHRCSTRRRRTHE